MTLPTASMEKVDHDAEASSMLDELLDLEEGLSDWEVSFIESLDRQRRAKRVFTERQRAKIAELWNLAFGRSR